MVQGAASVDQMAPGRMILGLGPSHKPAIEGTWGIPFEKPLSHLREYVTICRALLEQGEVNFEGEILTARGQLPGGPTQVQTMIAALRQKAFRLSGEITAGGISWMSPLPYIRDVAAPAQQAGADAAGTPEAADGRAHADRRLSEDQEAIRAAAKRQFGFYQRLPYYSQMLQGRRLRGSRRPRLHRPHGRRTDHQRVRTTEVGDKRPRNAQRLRSRRDAGRDRGDGG